MSGRSARKTKRWVLVAPEATPYASGGELAEAAGELAARLLDRGWHVELVVSDGPGPRRSDLVRGHARREPVAADLAGRTWRGDLWRCSGRDDLPVTVVTCEALWGPNGAETEERQDLRLGFFAKAALEVARRGERTADILHLFGARSALAAAYLDAVSPALGETRTLFSFVDLADDLLLDREAVSRLGLPAGILQPQLAEHHGRLSLLKTGLVFSDALVAASPRHAREVVAAPAGHGFEALLAERKEDLSGILSGIDESWDPESDPELASAFSAARLGGRARCRAALQSELGLGKSQRSTLAAFVGELTRERGFDIVLEALPELRAAGAQIVVAGRGEPTLEQAVLRAAREHPLHVAAELDADPGLVRRILAGTDLCLAPYREAPSGVVAARAMRYGAIPVAHAAGALSDLVKPVREREGEGGAAGANGFLFRTASAPALLRAVSRARAVLDDGKAAAAVRRAAMESSLGWAGATRRYEDLAVGLAKRPARRLEIPDPAPAPEAPSPPAAPYVDWGPPLPERYGEDTLALLVQGPRSVYAYWELSAETYARAGGEAALRLVISGGAELAHGLGDFGEYWFEAPAGARFSVELLAPDGALVLRSAPAETPREAPSEKTAVREVSRDRRRRGQISVPPGPPVPQPLYHFAADGPVSRYGPNVWQERAAHPTAPVRPAAALRPSTSQPALLEATSAEPKPPAPAAVPERGGSSPGSAHLPGNPPGSSEMTTRRDPR